MLVCMRSFSPDLTINLNYCHANLNLNLHVYRWVQV